ncbi:MAG: hypothetical protein ACC656_15725, partial [Candidatus Heimdallarchaeota archaeon]
DGLYDSCNGEYVDWLWDQSSTYMSYATQPNTMSTLDRIAIQRSTSFQYLEDLKSNIQNYIDDIFSRHMYLPDPLASDLDQVITLYDESLSLFTNFKYNNSISKLFDSLALLEILKQSEDTAGIDFSLTIIGLDNIAKGEVVDISIETWTTLSHFQVGENTILSIKYQSWDKVTVTVSYKGSVLQIVESRTWLSASINIDTSSIPRLEVPTTTIVSTKTVKTTITISSNQETSSDSQSDKGDTPVSTGSLFLSFTVIIIFIRRRKSIKSI